MKKPPEFIQISAHNDPTADNSRRHKIIDAVRKANAVSPNDALTINYSSKGKTLRCQGYAEINSDQTEIAIIPLNKLDSPFTISVNEIVSVQII